MYRYIHTYMDSPPPIPIPTDILSNRKTKRDWMHLSDCFKNNNMRKLCTGGGGVQLVERKGLWLKNKITKSQIDDVLLYFGLRRSVHN